MPNHYIPPELEPRSPQKKHTSPKTMSKKGRVAEEDAPGGQTASLGRRNSTSMRPRVRRTAISCPRFFIIKLFFHCLNLF